MNGKCILAALILTLCIAFADGFQNDTKAIETAADSLFYVEVLNDAGKVMAAMENGYR